MLTDKIVNKIVTHKEGRNDNPCSVTFSSQGEAIKNAEWEHILFMKRNRLPTEDNWQTLSNILAVCLQRESLLQNSKIKSNMKNW